MDVVECGKCHNMFRDEPAIASVCPKCGYENNADDEEGATTEYLRSMRG